MIEKMNIRYQPTGGDKNKLMAIKLIKDLTGLSLMECKDIIDDIYNNPGVTKSLDIRVDPFEFKKLIGKAPPELIVNSLEEERNLKILSLGLGEEDEYRECLKYYMMFDSKSMMDELLSILTKDQMIKLTEKLNKEYYG
jgi:hypothetical protein